MIIKYGNNYVINIDNVEIFISIYKEDILFYIASAHECRRLKEKCIFIDNFAIPITL
jgi:hypothetical protein